MNKHLEYQIGTNQDGSSSNHYKDMKIEPMEFILANSTIEELRGILRFSVTKYCWRDKDNMVEDWAKAKHYIEMITEELNNRSIPVPITDEIVPDRRADKPLWNFRATTFSKTNTIQEQVRHVVSEARELIEAYEGREPYGRVIGEAFDVAQALDTLCRIDPVGTSVAHDDMIRKNDSRGYYL